MGDFGKTRESRTLESKKYFINKLRITIINSIIFFLAVFVMISCINQEEEKKGMINNQLLNKTINYLALGDSYTIGEGVEEFERWPNQLGKELEQINYNVNSIDIIARTGWTTSNLLNAINNAEIKDYNLVSLLIGVNNQYQGRAFSLFELEFNMLLNKSIEIAGAADRVFVVSIPDYGVTPFGTSNSDRIRQEIDMYNEYISNYCESKNIPFINITEISRELGASEGALASDNLHPSGGQYKEWVNEILPVVIQIIN